MKWKLIIRREVKVVAALVAVSFLIAFGERKQGGSVCKDIIIELDNLNENYFPRRGRCDEASGQFGPGDNRNHGIDRINLKEIGSKIAIRQTYSGCSIVW